MEGDESVASLYRVLVDRCLNLEASHAKLREELEELVQHDKSKTDNYEIVNSPDETSFSGYVGFRGYFTTGGPFRNILECIGHAIYVYSAVSGKITFWYEKTTYLYLYIYT